MKNLGNHSLKRFWSTCLLLSVGYASVCLPTAFAASDPESFVVKVSCFTNDHLLRYEGSGILVQYQKSAYVLTSEHVVFHDNDPENQLQYQVDGKKPQKMIYINSDWGMGLAILKAPNEVVSDDLPKLEELAKTPAAKVDEQSISAGFPMRSQSMLVDVDGKVSSTTNISMVLADVEKMLEIKGAHGEYGMSGGAVLNGDLAPIGVLSHETPGDQNKILFAIPMAQAAQWAIHFISDPGAKPKLVRTTPDLLNSRGQRVRSGHLVIDWMEAYSVEGKKYLPAVTMGWDDTLQKPGLSPPTDPYPVTFFDAAVRRISAFLVNGQDTGFYPTVTVQRFRPRDVSRYKEMKELSSFVEFFRNLKNPDLKPMAGFTRQGAQGWYWFLPEYCEASKQVIYATYVNLGDKLWPAMRAISELSQCSIDDHTEFRSLIYPGEALSAQDIESVLNDPQYQEGWEMLQKYSQQDYDEVRSSLKKLEPALAELNI